MNGLGLGAQTSSGISHSRIKLSTTPVSNEKRDRHPRQDHLSDPDRQQDADLNLKRLVVGSEEAKLVIAVLV
jgi:hypothetical protein